MYILYIYIIYILCSSKATTCMCTHSCVYVYVYRYTHVPNSRILIDRKANQDQPAALVGHEAAVGPDEVPVRMEIRRLRHGCRFWLLTTWHVGFVEGPNIRGFASQTNGATPGLRGSRHLAEMGAIGSLGMRQIHVCIWHKFVSLRLEPMPAKM